MAARVPRYKPDIGHLVHVCPGCGKPGGGHVHGFDKCERAIRDFLARVSVRLLLDEVQRRIEERTER